MTGKILLIDDNPQIGRILEVFLLKTKFADIGLTSVGSLDEGLASIRLSDPPAIILDNYLGLHEDFREPLDHIRKLTAAPVILLTGSELSEIGLRTLPPSLDGYIWKVGMTPEDFELTLEKAMVRSVA